MNQLVPRTAQEIAAALVEQVRTTTDRLTDFNVGSVTRSLLEAVAAELDSYYQDLYFGLAAAIPESIYAGFDFPVLPARAATGIVTFSVVVAPVTPITIPSGTRVATRDGIDFRTTAAVTLTAPARTINAPVICTQTGPVGNVPAATITVLAAAPGQLDAVTNAAPFVTGADAESEAARQTRFMAYILSLAGGTLAALEYAAKIPTLTDPATGAILEYVYRAAACESVGGVDLYIYNGVDGASTALLAAVQRLIDGYRDPVTDAWIGGYGAAGTRVTARAMAFKPLAVSLELVVGLTTDHDATRAALATALDTWLRAALPGQQIRPLDLRNIAYGLPGVLGAAIVQPATALTVPAGAIMTLGTLTVTLTS